MNRRRFQALFAICVVALTANYASAQRQSTSQLGATQSILAPNPTQPARLGLPSVQFQYGSLSASPSRPIPAPRRQRRITPEMETVLAPPASHPSYPAQRLPSRAEPATNSQPGINPDASYVRQTQMGYGTNPYATDNIRQVSNSDILENDIYARGIGTPVSVIQEVDELPDPFGQLPANDFPGASVPTPLDATQDPEDPFQQRPGMDPRSTQPRPNVTPQPRVNPRSRTNPQDPTDPFQQRPGMDPRNPTQPRINPRQDPQDPLQQRPRVNPQDTDPRPLPNNLIDPTELPIPPRDRNVRPGDQGNGVDPPFDPSSQERNPFIYPNEAYPGQQSYPGPTSAYERSQPQGQPTPTDTSQVLYPPREQGMMGQQPYPPMQMRNPYPNFDAATGLPVQQGMPQTTFDQPAMLGEYQQVIEPGYGSSVACGEPDGWRPQLAIGENSCADTCYDPCCFEPLFYLAAFGGFSDLDDLDGGVPGVGNLSAGFNMDNGSSFGLALGQFQGANLRTELEYAFRYNDMDSLQLTDNQGAGLNLSSFNLDGNVTAHSGMANVIWQFQTAGSRWVNPYVGGGVGFVFLSAEADRVGRSVLADGADGNSSFAYQLFAGINTQLSSTMDVFVEYRHFGADKIRLQTDLVAANAGTGVFAGSYDYSSDNVHFGLRFKF